MRLLLTFLIVGFALKGAALSFVPTDAQYSAALDEIVMVSAAPNEVHIYHPASNQDTAISLAQTPLGILLSSDGLYAAVLQNGQTSYVNLVSATLTATPPGNTTFPSTSNYWLSPDGNRIYTAAGTVLKSSDMSYAGSLSGLTSVQSLSAYGNVIAAIPSGAADTEIRLYESTYFNQTARFVLPDTGHGKWAFFNQDGTQLYVIAQAASYELDAIDLSNPVTCAATLASSTNVSVAASGALEDASIASNTGCAFRATSNAGWIQLTSGNYGSGDTTLSYVVRPNTSAQSRTGTITLNSGASLMITQAGSSGPSSGLVSLSVNPIAADYSKALDKLVYVSAAPNELHLYDPNSQTDTFVPLALAPTSVSIDPSGTHAAVGHDGWISYIDLQSMAVQQIWPVSAKVSGLAVAGNGNIYFFANPANGAMLTLNINSGAVASVLDVGGGQIPRLAASANALYVSGSELSMWDLSQVSPVISTSAFPTCGNLWLSGDATRIYTGCATIHSASNFSDQGSLSMAGTVQWAADSKQNNSLAVIPLQPPGTNGQLIDSQLQMYSNGGLSFVSQSQLPRFPGNYTGHGKYLFWNAPESSLVVVEQADSTAPLVSNYGVYITPCSYSVSASSISAPATGSGSLQIAITAGKGCAWAAESQSGWIQVTNGSDIGAGTLTFSVGLNSSTGARSGTISVAGRNITISQAPALVLQVEPGALTFGSQQTGILSSASRNVTLLNAGSLPVSISGIGVSGAAAADFPMEGNSCGASLPAGSSCAVTIAFRPTAGARTASLTFTNNASGSESIPLSGTGVGYLPVSDGSLSPIPRTGDFDGDGKADFVVWRPSEGNWYILPSSGNPKPFWVRQWGLSGDIPLTGDFNGDKRSDFVVWRPSECTWYVLFSSQASSWPPSMVQQWGLAGDIPVPGDYDGDGKTDFAVWRPSIGTWYVLLSTHTSQYPAPSMQQQWGLPGDIPVPGDYDGDGKTDFAVWRPSNGTWYIIPSSNPTHPIVQQWGFSNDIPLTGDFDGDGKADFAVWRPSECNWYILPSSGFPWPFIQQQWGLPGDLPQLGDFFGEGKTSFAIWRPSNASWFVLDPNHPATYPVPSLFAQWGFSDDIPM